MAEFFMTFVRKKYFSRPPAVRQLHCMQCVYSGSIAPPGGPDPSSGSAHMEPADPEMEMGQWLIGQMGHHFWMGHMGRGSLPVTQEPWN